jgi:biopolymer transport protein ExbD
MLFKKRKKYEPEIPSASLPDIVFQLLIFFLLTTTLDVDKGLDLVLPPIGEQLEVSPKNISNILINDLGQILIDERIVTIKELENVVHNKLLANDKLIVSVKTSRFTKYKIYIQVLDQIKKAGVTRISIAEPEDV